MSWHVPAETVDDYVGGRLDPVRVMSIEAHVARCATCRAAIPVDPGWLATSWESVRDVVGAPARPWWEQLLARAGIPEHRARLLTATPALRRSWLLASAAVLAFAVLAAAVAGAGSGRQLAVFLAVAPILPVLAVATAYGPGVGPGYEIECTTPAAGPRLLLWRACAVLTVSVTMCTVAALFLPSGGWSAAAWLLPALALATGCLALATAVPLRAAAGALGTGWLTAVALFTARTDGLHLAFGPAAQLGYLAAAAGAVVVLAVRHRRLDPGEPR